MPTGGNTLKRKPLQHPSLPCSCITAAGPLHGQKQGDAASRDGYRISIGLLAYALASLVPFLACAERTVSRERSAPSLSATPPEAQVQVRTPVRYHVSSMGNDRNPGTARAPFRSIQHAADAARAGDTVIVGPGLYIGGDRIVSLEHSGSSAAWITFRAEPKWTAVLDGRGGISHEGWYFGPNVGFVRVEGFEIRDMQEHGFDTYGGGVHDVSIVRNHVHHIGRNCTDTSNGRTGASLGAGTRRVILDGNVWHDIGRLGPGEGGCSPRTKYYQNHDHGIYVADADEVTIQNNVFYSFRRGWPIHRYYSKGSPVRGLTVVNNTFVGPNPYRSGQIILAGPTGELRIENNIFYAPQSAALLFEDRRVEGARVRYNMVYPGELKEGRARGVSFEHNWERTDPRFTGPDNFRLKLESPALDAGLPLAWVTHDAEGVRRPRGRGYDLGAYER